MINYCYKKKQTKLLETMLPMLGHIVQNGPLIGPYCYKRSNYYLWLTMWVPRTHGATLYNMAPSWNERKFITHKFQYIVPVLGQYCTKEFYTKDCSQHCNPSKIFLRRGFNSTSHPNNITIQFITKFYQHNTPLSRYQDFLPHYWPNAGTTLHNIA